MIPRDRDRRAARVAGDHIARSVGRRKDVARVDPVRGANLIVRGNAPLVLTPSDQTVVRRRGGTTTEIGNGVPRVADIVPPLQGERVVGSAAIGIVRPRQRRRSVAIPTLRQERPWRSGQRAK